MHPRLACWPARSSWWRRGGAGRRWPARRWRYVALLFPALGLFAAGPQAVADRYSYLACLGWALLAGGAVAWPWAGARVVRAVAAAIVVVLIALTVQQVRVWRDSVSLWSHAVALEPANRLRADQSRRSLRRAGAHARRPSTSTARCSDSPATRPRGTRCSAGSTPGAVTWPTRCRCWSKRSDSSPGGPTPAPMRGEAVADPPACRPRPSCPAARRAG